MQNTGHNRAGLAAQGPGSKANKAPASVAFPRKTGYNKKTALGGELAVP